MDILLLCYCWDRTGAASPQYRDTEVTKGICNACETQIKALLCPLETAASFQQNNTKSELEGSTGKCLHESSREKSLLMNYMVLAVRAKTPPKQYTTCPAKQA